MFHSFAVKRIFIPGRICFSTQKIAVQSLLLGVVGQSVTCKQSVWKSHTISPKNPPQFPVLNKSTLFCPYENPPYKEPIPVQLPTLHI